MHYNNDEGLKQTIEELLGDIANQADERNSPRSVAPQLLTMVANRLERWSGLVDRPSHLPNPAGGTGKGFWRRLNFPIAENSL